MWRLAGLAQGVQLHRAMLQAGGGLLQGLDHSFRGTGLLSQQSGGLAAGFIGVEGEALNPLKRLFYSPHEISPFLCLLFLKKLFTIWLRQQYHSAVHGG